MSGQRVLYLDDEESLVFLVVRMLKSLGYHSAGFTDPAAALAAFRAEPAAFDLVLADRSMPGMNGLEFAQSVLEVRPQARVVIATGFVVPEEAESARLIGVTATVQKPGNVAEIGELVRRLLAHPGGL
ncbi:MAG TPA: response regulator [Steroidobacteraceae bacterium]|nr:response regulator [Steroidobacteraceae bacterium]